MNSMWQRILGGLAGGLALALAGMAPLAATAAPSPFDASLTDEFMDQVNTAIADVVQGMDAPIAGFELAFATLSGADQISLDTMAGGVMGNAAQVTVTIQDFPLLFAEGSTIDGPNCGATWQGEDPIGTETYIGGAGFVIALGSGGSLPQVDCLATTMTFQISKANLLTFGVPQDAADWLFDPANSPEEVSAAFFEQFTYHKVFAGADPAIAPQDVIAFLSLAVGEGASLPDSVSMTRNDNGGLLDTLDVSIRYLLLDAAPPVADMPFMFFSQQGWTLSASGGTVATMADGLLMIFDGNRDGSLIDPVILASPALPAVANTTVGGSFPVTAENVDLLEFTAKDKFLAEYYDPVKDPDEEKLKKAAVKLAQKVDWEGDNGNVNLLWGKKIALYSKKALKAWTKAGGTVAGFLAVPGNQDALAMTLKTVNKVNAPIERTIGVLTLQPPTINRINGHSPTTALISGTWFGTKKPKVWMEYRTGDPAVTKAKRLKVLKPVDMGFVDAKGKPAYMNAADGVSQAVVEFTPEMVPPGFTGIVIDNGVGVDVRDPF
jgi:hypothetical protein